jgi:hypothetical protein
MDPPDFLFCSPSGKDLVTEILEQVLPFSPHDDQLLCVCKLLDGIDVLAILLTNAGKTGLFFMYVLVIIALKENTTLCPLALRRKLPSANPVMVVILPTKGLCEEKVIFMSTYFKLLSLKNSSARRDGKVLSICCRDY